jgi:predicted dehydrogenase
MKTVIIGSGLQARRRGQAIIDSEGDSLCGVFSDNDKTVARFADDFRCTRYSSVEEMLYRDDVDAVIVCTPPNSHFDFVKMALDAKKHVLVEKPFTQNAEQSATLVETAKVSEKTLRCGFNHRFHPSLLELKEILNCNKLGPIRFSRSLYGMGIRPNYRSEWRANLNVAAGGQFMEQGSHLIDLMQFLIGGVDSIFLKRMNFVLSDFHGEDSGLAILNHKNGAISNITSTLLQWHNRFSLEIFGDFGFAFIEGLGGSYGVETLKIGWNIPDQPFKSELIEFRGGDLSWLKEWSAFKSACSGNKTICATPEEAHHVMNIVEAGYKSAKIGSEVSC